jgi:isopenicillin-N N-acyltransferase-like protein
MFRSAPGGSSVDLRFYEFGGKPYDIGYQHGEALRDMIVDFYHDVLSRISKKRGAKAEVIERKALVEAAKYVPYLSQEAPHLITEVEGLAAATGLSVEQVFVINCDREFEVESDECTGFVANEFATANGEIIMAQNRDREKHDLEHTVAMKLVPQKGPSMVMSILAGHLGSIGLNSSGIAMGHNFLASPEWRPGIPRGIVPRLILEQERLADVINLMSRTHRASSRNFAIATGSGEACHIETTPTTYRILWAEPERGYVAHSNHYLHPDLVHFNEERLPAPGNTIWRLRRIHHLLAGNKGKIDVDKTKELLRDHYDYPFSVCVHPLDGVRDNMSISSIIALPAEKRILITAGNPCCSEFHEFRP